MRQHYVFLSSHEILSHRTAQSHQESHIHVQLITYIEGLVPPRN